MVSFMLVRLCHRGTFCQVSFVPELRETILPSRVIMACLMGTRRRTFIRQWREYRGLTLEKLAEQLGVDHSTLSRIELGRRGYTQDRLECLAVALGTDPASLIACDPAEPEAIWSIWDRIPKGERARAAELLKVFAGPESNGVAPAQKRGRRSSG
jgi:transcriptional regulator with XRE-family HTH domain